MNDCKIYLITKKGKKENYTSLTFLENRDDIQYLEIKDYKEKKLIFNKNIEIIKISNSLIDQFPLINKNIRIIEIIQSKIQKIPDLSNYKNLEELNEVRQLIVEINSLISYTDWGLRSWA